MYLVQHHFVNEWKDKKQCETLDEAKKEIHKLLNEGCYLPRMLRIIKVIDLEIKSEYMVNASDYE